MTLAEYNNETQLYRDQIEKVWQSFEKNEDRIRDLTIAQITGKAQLESVEAKAWYEGLFSIGSSLATIFGGGKK
jgi:prefoldin subunit 5